MLELQRFLIKEQVAFLRAASIYHIFDLETQEQVGMARERPGHVVTMLRWFLRRRHLPVRIEVREMVDESLVFTMHRPLGLWPRRISIYDADDRLMGYLSSGLFRWRRGFGIYDSHGYLFAELKGDWVDWNFVIVTPADEEIGSVSRSWAGLGRELFTSADNYVLAVHEELEEQPIAKMLLLAAALAVDMVYFEDGR